MRLSKFYPLANILNLKNNSKSFFSPFLFVSFECRACPPKVICYWFYPWTILLHFTLLEAVFNACFMFFAKMPNIEQVIASFFVLLHIFFNLPVVNISVFIFYFWLYLKSWQRQVFPFCLNFLPGYNDIFP